MNKQREYWNRCDECGRFISIKDFDNKKAIRYLFSVDSEYSSEQYTTLCSKHKIRGITTNIIFLDDGNFRLKKIIFGH